LLFTFLDSRREPLLLKASQTYRQLKDSSQGVDDIVSLLKETKKNIKSQIEFQTHKPMMFNTTLHSTHDKRPNMTHTAQSNPAVLQLAALNAAIYDSSEENHIAIGN
jgi:hypothetical protein